MSEPIRLNLKPGRERSLLRRHPWVFSGAVAQISGEPRPGETVLVCDAQDQPIGLGAYSPDSQIRVRMWTWNPEEAVDEAFFERRIAAAVRIREEISARLDTNAARLVHGESDGLPGLVVDRFGDVLVAQALSWASEAHREIIFSILARLDGVAALYERSDADVRRLEGLAERAGWLSVARATESVTIVEHGLRFALDLAHGHKTGFYLDQRANRRQVGELAAGREVLDAFCYTGGFGIHALAGRAERVTFLDSSAAALEGLRANLALNGLADSDYEILAADAFTELRKFRDRGRQFDLIVLDPPKFAPTRAQAEKAARGYKDINLLAFTLLRPGGLLFTFSCSGGVEAELFQKIVAGAALDAGVTAQVLGWMRQDCDHPVDLNFPEGSYLKGLLCRVAEPAG